VPGTNGLAIAALVCGIVGLFPVAAVFAVVLGIVALNQLRERVQRGRGMAIAGIVLGTLALVGWVILFVVAVATSEPERNASGQVTAASTVAIDTLRAGDCFDGVPKKAVDYVDDVTVKPCAGPHEGQVGAIVTLPAGDFPGDKKSADLAGRTCGDKLEPLMREEAFGDLDLLYVYPDSAFAWKMDRSAICILAARTGTTTGSALT
jgi:hypothetical protein